ncbi:MAG: tRNA pseudouridine(55) synthase TruB [Pyrinomonadaceae bacterium]|nr:tRNA pseudouridine(55) synthase TruB [Pyrinomonadaceae bacterium]
MNGILIIDKPEGFTSHDVVARVRRILETKKIGHTGTLDPFATGVLVMLVGKATRLARFLDRDEKSYEATIRFGFETDTGDRTGARRDTKYAIRNTDVEPKVSNEKVRNILPQFTGEIEQIPPMYSAKKVKGKKLYELARKGVEIEREAVKVKISALRITGNQSRDNNFKLEVVCSAGTYIRTLAEDIGREIGIPCHLAELRRIKAGKFNIAQAVSIEELEEMSEAQKINRILVPMNEAVSHLPGQILTTEELKRVQNGMKVDASFEGENVQNIRLIDADQNLVAIGKYMKQEQQIQPRIVLINQ